MRLKHTLFLLGLLLLLTFASAIFVTKTQAQSSLALAYNSPTLLPNTPVLEQTVPPSTGLFVLMVYHDALGGLSVTAPDGSNQRQIRATGDKPVWSNYGQQLAFIDKDIHGVSQVFVMNSLGHYVTQITQTSNGVCSLPSWSSNDSQIAYGVSVAVNRFSNRCDIYKVPVDGSSTPQFVFNNVSAFTWLPNGTFSFSQPSAGSGSDVLGMAKLPSSTNSSNGSSAASSTSTTQSLPASIPQSCGSVTNMQVAHDGTAIAYQVLCSDATNRYYITNFRPGGTTITSVTPSVVVWLPHGGVIYGTQSQLSYATDISNIGSASSIPLTALSTMKGDLSTAQATSSIVAPDPVAGDRVIDPDFISNSKLQSELTLSNSYDPATGENNFTAPDLKTANGTTQPYASSTGHIDPANGQYKPGSDMGAALPDYGLYNRFPVTDYANPVGGGYSITNEAITLPGSGSPLDFRFTYSPQNGWQQSQQSFGHIWTHNFNIKLILACDNFYPTWETPINGRIVLQESSGARQTFIDNLYGSSSGTFLPGQNTTRFTPEVNGPHASLERLKVTYANNTISYGVTDNWTEGDCPSLAGQDLQTKESRVYKLTLADDTTYLFDWLGRLMTIDHVHQSTNDWHPLKFLYYGGTPSALSNDPNSYSALPNGYNCGTTPSATSIGAGELVRVLDVTGNNYLDLCYQNGSNNIIEVHDKRNGSKASPAAPSLQFIYDNNTNLVQTKDWRGKTWSYTYGTQVYDPNTPTIPKTISVPPVLTSVISPNNVALAVVYNVNVWNKDCTNSTAGQQPYPCLTIGQRISGAFDGTTIHGATETFDLSGQITPPNASTCSPCFTTVTTGIGHANNIPVGTWVNAGVNIFTNTSADTTTGTVTYFKSGDVTTSNGYKTNISESSINSTGASIAFLYGASNNTNGAVNNDPYQRVTVAQPGANLANSGKNIVIYHYNNVDLPNEPKSGPFHVQDYLLGQVDDTISGSISGSPANICRYTYVYQYTNTNYPTLPTQFDKIDLSKTNAPLSNTGKDGSGCNTGAANLASDQVYHLMYYNADGYLEAITDPNGTVTFYTYNANGQLASQTKNYNGSLAGTESDLLSSVPIYNPGSPSVNITISYQYDADGRLTDVIDRVPDQNGKMRDDHTVYDTQCNLANDPLCNSVEQFLNYDASTFPTQTASKNVATATQYDDSGRIVRVIDARGYSTNFNYEGWGRLASVTRNDASNNIVVQTIYGYSAFAPLGGVSTGYTQVAVKHMVTAGVGIANVVCYDNVHRATAYVENLSSSNLNWNCTSSLNPGAADQNAFTEVQFNGTAQGHLPYVIINHTLNLQTLFAYDAFGNPIQVASKDLLNGNAATNTSTWNYGYDQFRRLVNVSDALAVSGSPLSHNQWFCYNSNSQIVYQVINPAAASNVPGCVNDDSGIAAVSGGPTGYWSGQVLSSTAIPVFDTSHAAPTVDQSANIQTWLMYDALGQKTDTYDAIGRRTTTSYDALGRINFIGKNNTAVGYGFGTFVAAQPDLNNNVSVVYDLVNRTQTMTDWLGRATKTEFDALGRKSRLTENYNPSQPAPSPGQNLDQNIITTYQYDPLGKVIAQSDPVTNPVPTFDANGNIVGQHTSITYDALGNPLTATDPVGAVTTKTYDMLGRVTQIQSPDAPIVNYTYDGLNRLSQTQTQALPPLTQSYQYDLQRNMTGFDGTGRATFATNNIFGRPTQVTQNYISGQLINSPTAFDQNVQTNYQYDLLGELTAVTRPNSTAPTTTYAYNTVGEVSGITQAVTSTTAMTQTMIYDAVGRTATTTQQSGNKTTTLYDALDKPLNLNRTTPSDNVSLSYSYNGVNKQVVMTDVSGTTTYKYDALGRMIQASGGATGQTLAYTYNQGGQRTSLNMSGTGSPTPRTITYNYQNQAATTSYSTLQSLTLSGGWSSTGTVNYTYLSTAQGISHLPSQIKMPNNVTETLGYDGDLRLTGVDYSNATNSLFQVDYSLDNNGNRLTSDEYLNEPPLMPCQVSAACANGLKEKDTIGIYRPTTGQFLLRNTNSTGAPDISATFNPAPASDKIVPIVGNWTDKQPNQVVDTIGTYDQTTAQVSLRYTNTSGAPDKQFIFGQPGDQPLVGRWSPASTHDGFGVYRPSNGLMFLTNTLDASIPNYILIVGVPGDQVIAGNWNGGANDGIGLYRPATSTFYLTNTVSSGTFYPDYVFTFGNANGHYIPIAGNWTGTYGNNIGSGVGLFDTTTGTFYLKNTLQAGFADYTIPYGLTSDVALAGAWSQPIANPSVPPTATPPVIVPPTSTPYTPPPRPTPTPGNGIGPTQPAYDGNINFVKYVPGLPYNPQAAIALANRSFDYLLSPTNIGNSTSGLLHRLIVYSYDRLNHLTDAKYTDNTATGTWNTYEYQYSYDLDGNRTAAKSFYYPDVNNTASSVFDQSTYAYNLADQLIVKSDLNPADGTLKGTGNFSYSTDGQMVYESYTRVGQPTSIPQYGYAYDSAGRLTVVTDYTNNLFINYIYDGLDNRVIKNATSGTTLSASSYLYDMTSQLPQMVGEFRNNASPIWYISGGKALGQDVSGTPGALSYFAYDGLGSVRAVFDTNGTQRSLTNYDPYGQIMEHVNDLTPHLGYTGALTDESGFVYLNARVYDPHLGTFLTGDTLEGTAANPGSFNRYGYVQGDPINAIDPSGHVLVDPGKGDFGGVGGGGYLGYGQMGGAASSGAGGTTISIVADTIEDGITIFRIINKAIRTILDAPIPTANSSTSQVAITMAPQASASTSSTTSNDPCGFFAGTPICKQSPDETCSFSPDTLVQTDHGLFAIDALKKGDHVLAYNQQTVKNEYESIDAVLIHADSVTEDVNISGETIHTTPEHSFYTFDRGWVQADDLKHGELVKGANGLYGVVQAITVISQPQVMYNLTIHDDHTFFVGRGQWLVHNSDPDCNAITKKLKRIFKIYPADVYAKDGGQCKQCAEEVYKVFKDAGEDAQIVRITTRTGRGFIGTISGTGTANGVQIAESGYHEFVQVGDKVYDALTGPEGMSFGDYQKLFGGEKLWDSFFTVTTSKP